MFTIYSYTEYTNRNIDIEYFNWSQMKLRPYLGINLFLHLKKRAIISVVLVICQI